MLGLNIEQEYLGLFPDNRRMAVLASLRIEAEIYKINFSSGMNLIP